MGPDVWFQYAATCTGTLTVDACGDFNTRLALYSDVLGNCVCPVDASTEVICDDDSGCLGSGSKVELEVTQGDCFTIRIMGAGDGVSGVGDLTIVCGNDDCANAAPLSVPDTVSGSTGTGNVFPAPAPCGLGRGLCASRTDWS